MDGPGIALKGVPTAYGLIDFAAALPNRTTAVVRFACNPHAGGLSQALSQVIVRLVVPGLVPDATGQSWSLFDRQSIVIEPDNSTVDLSIPLRVDRHPIKSDDGAISGVRAPRFSPDTISCGGVLFSLATKEIVELHLPTLSPPCRP